MKIITRNANSVHAWLPRVTAPLARHQPDLACLEEIKTSSGGRSQVLTSWLAARRLRAVVQETPRIRPNGRR
jgi:exonuclease III